jgi:hypothetical protein
MDYCDEKSLDVRRRKIRAAGKKLSDGFARSAGRWKDLSGIKDLVGLQEPIGNEDALKLQDDRTRDADYSSSCRRTCPCRTPPGSS